MTKVDVGNVQNELDWVQLRKDIGPAHESFSEKFIRRVKENPVVPVGVAATTFALGFGLYNFKVGNRKMSQTMMRARIAAQGFTVAALIGGVLMTYAK